MAQVAILRQTMLSATELAASRALTWGLLSFVFFCLPVPNVLSFLAYKRAQSSAREAALKVPTRATVGLCCSLFTGALCVACWVWLVTDLRADYARLATRKAELAGQIAAHTPHEVLDHPYACALAEQYLLVNGFNGSTNTGAFRDLDCAGAVTIANDRAEMPDYKFRASSNATQQTLTLCFKRGERWFVESARATGCDLKR